MREIQIFGGIQFGNLVKSQALVLLKMVNICLHYLELVQAMPFVAEKMKLISKLDPELDQENLADWVETLLSQIGTD